MIYEIVLYLLMLNVPNQSFKVILLIKGKYRKMLHFILFNCKQFIYLTSSVICR